MNRSTRITGALLALAGLLPLIAVINPQTWDVWSPDGAASGWQLTTERHNAMTAATWLIWAGLAISVAGTVLLSRLLNTAAATAAQALFGVGAALALASLTFSATVDLPLTGAGQAMPDWYPIVGSWINGLFTAHFALLAPAALILYGAEVIRTRIAPKWTGWFVIVMALGLLGQFAAFQGALPFPEFFSLLALGLPLALRSGYHAE
jgi:hypothetical protein